MAKPQFNLISGLIALVAVVVLGSAAYFFTRVPDAPQVTFKTLSDGQITTAQLKGKVTLVNFWATSCVTCVAEMPKIVETHQKYQAQGYETIAVAMSYDPPNYVSKFVESRKLPFKVSLDLDGAIAGAFSGVRLTPTTFVIDKKGRIIKQYLGEPKFAELHALIEAALKEPA